jgi:predicted anti-sigma-YlaC factor YlaD
MVMRCELIREAISAAIDGEDLGVPEQLVQQHLADCARCREWRRRAELASRQARVALAPELGDLTDRVLTAVRAQELPGRRDWTLTRVGLCVIAVLQLAITIPILVLGHDREAPLHVSHEMGSWDAALAIGLLLAAKRPSRAEGMTALVGVGAALLCVTAAIDLAAGRTSVTDEAPHLLCVAGWLLLHRLSVLHSYRSPGPALSALHHGDSDETFGGTPYVSLAESRADVALPDASAHTAMSTDLSA